MQSVRDSVRPFDLDIVSALDVHDGPATLPSSLSEPSEHVFIGSLRGTVDEGGGEQSDARIDGCRIGQRRERVHAAPIAIGDLGG